MNDKKDLIKWIRESDRREQIIDGCLSLLRNEMGRFCFDIIYDIPKYKEEAWEILHKCYQPTALTKRQLVNIMYKTAYGKKYLDENFDELIHSNNENWFNDILSFMFNNYDYFKNRLKDLSLNKDLHIRFSFMKYLITIENDKISLFYDDITKYLTSFTYQLYEQYTFAPEYMNVEDICELAIVILTNCDYSVYLKIKKFIFDNYEKNELAYHLLEREKKYNTDRSYSLVIDDDRISELENDLENYFKTANKCKLEIYRDYSHLLSKDLLEKYKKFLFRFRRNDNKIDDKISRIDYLGLSNTLEKYVDKYLSLSQNDESYFIESGTTASSFKIGDYVIKLISEKWSYEDIICPNLYIILPNLEEEYLRDQMGIVRVGIEVQKYLQKDAKDVPRKYFDMWKEELEKLGYYTTDTLIDGNRGDNCRLLDNYQESGNPNPPEWFKKYPIVLVDRDRIYKLENKRPKQMVEGY